MIFKTGADVYDTSRVFGYPIGTQIHQSSTFAPPVLNGQQNASSIPTTPSLFPSQHTISDRPATVDFSVSQFPQIYNNSVSMAVVICFVFGYGPYHQPCSSQFHFKNFDVVKPSSKQLVFGNGE